MIKNYVFILFFTLSFFAIPKVFAQDFNGKESDTQKIEALSIYPNPVTNNRQFVNITTRYNSIKQIEFFNVIGKKIYATVLNGRELNISRLSTGVYFIKITENSISETRKLVIK
ncbi:T9SS type A sorting domain-containing protein [uncultured Algibacter sp.]|uniref:T9SS type A sorting domain-containing protein n=1 Tax=uncultured Algibacter sp. TaxID=298659 RepID=UPI00261161D3|nr:T9SS type A sorting domain-containing protein [uncultured Algibacter sp.]